MSNLQVEMLKAKASVSAARVRLFKNLDLVEDVYREERASVQNVIESVSKNIHAVTHPFATLSRHTGALMLVASSFGYFFGRKLFTSPQALAKSPDKISTVKINPSSEKTSAPKSLLIAALTSLVAELALKSVRSAISKKLIPEHRGLFESTFDKHFKPGGSTLNNESKQASPKIESSSW